MANTVSIGGRLRIGEQLVRAGLISQDQLHEALGEQKRTGRKIVATLVTLGYIDQATFLNFLARQPGIASIDLAGYCIPTELISLVPAEFARLHEIVPMDRMGSDLTVGMACPLDTRVIDQLQSMTQLRVRALLVAPEAIRLVLDRYYPEAAAEEQGGEGASPAAPSEAPVEVVLEQVESAIGFEQVMALVRSVTSLPSLPDTVQRVQEVVEDEYSGARDVAEVLKGDPALAAKVIGLANAPAHGFKHQVDTIEGATSLLGLREVYSITLAAAVVDCFGDSMHFDYPAFWRRSVAAGNIAKILARAGNVNAGGGVFAAGLLHDIGRAVFAEVAAVAYGALDHRVPDGDLVAGEHELFGIAHPEVGYIVAKAWGLPGPLTEAIRFHQCPERAVESPELANVVAVAALLADHVEFPDRFPFEQCEDRCHELLGVLGVNQDQLTSIISIARAMRAASPV